jgi:hypothetical protein
MKRCAVECLPQRFPTATFSARAASAHREEVRRARPGADEINLASQIRLRNSGTGRATEAW